MRGFKHTEILRAIHVSGYSLQDSPLFVFCLNQQHLNQQHYSALQAHHILERIAGLQQVIWGLASAVGTVWCHPASTENIQEMALHRNETGHLKELDDGFAG